MAAIFGIDVLGFAVMSNHLHVVARTRPDVVKGWSDDDIALRWWRLFPHRRNEDHSPAEPTEMELNVTRNDASGLTEKRKRLSEISWFMRCLVEPIARRSNKEDDVTGLIDWTGRQIRKDKVGQIPADCARSWTVCNATPKRGWTS